LKAEVADLMAKAEAADQADLPDGLSIPEELARREERLRKLAEAKAKIEARGPRSAMSVNADIGLDRTTTEHNRQRFDAPRKFDVKQVVPDCSPSAIPSPIPKNERPDDGPSAIVKPGGVPSGQSLQCSHDRFRHRHRSLRQLLEVRS
jgi:hypothetical protein